MFNFYALSVIYVNIALLNHQFSKHKKVVNVRAPYFNMYCLIFKVGKALAACRCVVHDNLIRGISIALIWEFGILS